MIVDGRMDSSITDNEIIYFQTCLEGVVHTNFIYCWSGRTWNRRRYCPCYKKGHGNFIDWDQYVAKLVALGSDGAVVMPRKNSGVITFLEAQQTSMIAVHCSGHRLELAYKESIEKFPLAEKVFTLLTGLSYMYKNSALE